MIRRFLLVIGGWWSLAAGAFAASDEGATFPLQYVASSELAEEVGALFGQPVSASPKPGEKLVGQPPYRSKKPLYVGARLGPEPDNLYTLVLDESQGTRSGYDRLYVDADNDEDLRDEKPLTGTMNKSDFLTQGQFTGVEVPIAYGPQVSLYRFAVWFLLLALPNQEESSSPAVFIQPEGYYQGTVEIAGTAYRFAALDCNANGLFNDPGGVQPELSLAERFLAEGDRFLLDLDGNGRFDPNPGFANPEAFPIAKYTLLGERFYSVQVAPSGESVTIAPATLPLGSLRNAHAPFTVGLVSDEGLLRLTSDSGTCPVPVGTYRLYATIFTKQDQQGHTWRLEGTGAAAGENLVITADTTTEARFGPPLREQVRLATAGEDGEEVAHPTYRPGDTVTFNLQLVGQGGETYSVGGLTEDGQPLPAPAFKIYGPQKKVVAQGRFKYG